MYYVVREGRCDEGEIYARTLINSGKGYKDIEEAKKVIKKEKRLEEIETTSDIEKEKAIALAEDREYKRSRTDDYSYSFVIVEFNFI